MELMGLAGVGSDDVSRFRFACASNVRGLVAQPSAHTKPDLCHRDLLHLYNNLTTYLTLIHSAILSGCLSLINLSLHTIMLRASKETEAYRKDAKHNHNLLGKEEREKLLQVR